MERYDTYKESGIDWVGQVPFEWKITPFKYVCDYFKGRKPQIDYDTKGDGLIPYLSMEFLRGQTDSPLYVNSNDNIVKVEDKDLLLLWDGSKAGEFLLGKEGALSSTMALLKIDTEQVDKDFLYYVLKSFEPRLQSETVGMGIPHVDGTYLSNNLICFPDFSEQQKIRSYLNHKTNQIAQIIQQKELLLQKLQAKRQAIINEAVTKGLNPIVPMKPSGVEWLGAVPEHWEVKKLGYLAEIKRGAGYQLLEITDDDTGEELIRISDFSESDIKKVKSRSEFDFFRVRAGDILIAGTGATAGISILVEPKFDNMVHSYNSLRIVVNAAESEYLYYCLQSLHIKEQMNLAFTGSAQPFLDIRRIFDFIVAKPKTSEEQRKIVQHLKVRIGKIEETCSLIEKQIGKLKSYRQSLISEVVTGKIKVV